MSQSVKDELSIGDSHLIDKNHLGAPLSIYRIKPGSGRFFYKVYQFTIVISSLILVITAILGFIGWHQIYLFITPLFGCACTFFMGIYGLRTEMARLQSARAIVCEHGLLQIIKRIRNNDVEVVRWTNILRIRKAFTFSFIGQENYYIDRREGKVLILDGCYQDIDELILLIQKRSEVI